MTTNFPTALDTIVKPQGSLSGGTDQLSTVGVIHGKVHQDEIDAILALQAKVGINGSADTASLDYIVNNNLIKRDGTTPGTTGTIVFNAATNTVFDIVLNGVATAGGLRWCDLKSSSVSYGTLEMIAGYVGFFSSNGIFCASALNNFILINGGNIAYATPGTHSFSGPVAVSGTISPRANATGAGTAPIKFTSGSLMTAAEAGAMEYDGAHYFLSDATPTRRFVAAPITGRLTGQTGAVASVLAYTPAVDTSFIVCANISFTTSTTYTFTLTVSYTDENSVSRTQTMNFSLIGGGIRSSVANTDGSAPRAFVPLQIRCKAGTAVTIATTGTFTTVTYNVEASLTPISY